MKFNFSRFTPQIRLFIVETRKPKIFGFKMLWKEESEKFSLS